jgi:hypothetical protein
MSAIEEVRQVIQSQLNAVEREVASLRDTLKTLQANDHVPPAPETKAVPNVTAAKPRRTKTGRQNGRKRTTEVVPLGKLEQLLASTSDGLSAAALAKQTNGSPDQIRALLKDLEAAGKVRRTGERRGTRWSIITEEDWIAQRAAELEQRGQLRRATS